MPGDNDDEKQRAALVRELTGPPLNMSPLDAIKAVANGTAESLLAPVRADTKAAVDAACDEMVKAFKDRLPKRDGGAAHTAIASSDKQRAAAQPDFVCQAAPRLSGQNSDPEPRRRFFVCTECLGAFVAETGAAERVACPCGLASCSFDGLTPGWPIITAATFEVTPLVECGKLSVVLPTPAQEREPQWVTLAVHNRTRRNIEHVNRPPLHAKPEPTAEVRTRVATESVKGAVIPATSYICRAAERGAAVRFNAHYHVRSCGVSETDDGKYLKRELTGDARFVGEVIVREKVNEADGSLMFVPVIGCARCQGNHADPVAFWKLTNPVVDYNADGTVKEVIATHFAYCPANGEPIMMVSSEPTPEPNFRDPAPPGEVEAMRAIGGGEPIDGAQPPRLQPVTGGRESVAFQQGYEAGSMRSLTIDSNPFELGTNESDDFRRGFMNARDDRHGE